MIICDNGITRQLTPEEMAEREAEVVEVIEDITLTPEEEIIEIQSELSKLQERLASLMS